MERAGRWRPAYRLTSNLGSVTYPALAPDGKLLAFVGREEGAPEVYVAQSRGQRPPLDLFGLLVPGGGVEPGGDARDFSSTYKRVI
ncbi:MAG: hypothetical protein R2911_09545 [Caldilineaceae bacterium]